MSSSIPTAPSLLAHDGVQLAYHHQSGDTTPALFFLSGYASDMNGTKANFLATQCATINRGFTRFDYRGTGQSSGRFRDASIGEWFSDALAVFDHCTKGQQLVIGSSMGGWLALKLALARPERVAGILGIAAAPDFTEDLIWQQLPIAEQNRLLSYGYITSDGLIYTAKLIQEGRQHLLLRNGDLPISCPVHFMQGKQDASVPWQIVERIANVLPHAFVATSFIADGDHRLSRDQDCAQLWQIIMDMMKLAKQGR